MLVKSHIHLNPTNKTTSKLPMSFLDSAKLKTKGRKKDRRNSSICLHKSLLLNILASNCFVYNILRRLSFVNSTKQSICSKTPRGYPRVPGIQFYVEWSSAGQALIRGPVKREAGVTPALSRSGDGNERLHGESQRTVSRRWEAAIE